MAIKTYYQSRAEQNEEPEDKGYFVIVFDSPAWLYNDPRPHKFHLLAVDRWATEIEEGCVDTFDEVKEWAKEACTFYEIGVNGTEKRDYVPPEKRLYGVRTFPQGANGEDDWILEGDTIRHEQQHLTESEIPGFVEKRFGRKGFDASAVRELEWGDNVNYTEPGEMSIVRLNDKKPRWRFLKGAPKGKSRFPIKKRK